MGRMWSFANQDLNRRRNPSKLHQKVQHSGGKIRRRAPGLYRPVWPVPLEVQRSGGMSNKKVLSLHRSVWPAILRALEKIPKMPKRKDRVSNNSWPSMKRKELLRNKRSDQIKIKVQIHHQSIVSNRLLMCNKVIILLRNIHLVGQLLHGSGRILTTTHLWIILECICVHTLFNIFLHIQIMMSLKDRLLLAIIRSKANLIAVKMVLTPFRINTRMHSNVLREEELAAAPPA